MPFTFEQTSISGVVVITPTVFQDNRGYFKEVYQREAFEQNNIPGNFVQENHSFSKAGILRGLHFQLAPKAQGKLVRAVAGKIFDVAVDVRKNSPTLGRWMGIELSAENHKMLYVPDWCAHGFSVLDKDAEVIYQVTEAYSPQHERGIAWNDADLAIDWRMADPELSESDKKWPPLSSYGGSIF